MSTSLYLYINGKKADAPDLKPFSYVGIREITVTSELLILLIDRLIHSKAFVGFVFLKKAKLLFRDKKYYKFRNTYKIFIPCKIDIH